LYQVSLHAAEGNSSGSLLAGDAGRRPPLPGSELEEMQSAIRALVAASPTESHEIYSQLSALQKLGLLVRRERERERERSICISI